MEQWEIVRNDVLYTFYEAFRTTEKTCEPLTPIEKIMAYVLLISGFYYGSANFKVSTQHVVGKYRADFYLEYNPFNAGKGIKKIIIECDGHDFHEKTKEQASRDKERDRFFQTEGYIVLRYSGSDIYRDPYRVGIDLEKIIQVE
jgi:very-short-patch-repair endonuclease